MATHTPPKGLLDGSGFGVDGSSTLRDWLVKHKPLLACFGHLHLAGGQAKTLAIEGHGRSELREIPSSTTAVPTVTRGGGRMVVANVAMADEKPMDPSTGHYPWHKNAKPQVARLRLPAAGSRQT